MIDDFYYPLLPGLGSVFFLWLLTLRSQDPPQLEDYYRCFMTGVIWGWLWQLLYFLLFQ